MAVDDHGLEALKKSAEEITPGSKANYYLKTGILIDGMPLSEDNPIPVSGTVMMPDGFSTSEKQDEQTILLTNINQNLVKSDTDNVIITSSILPTGAATETTQVQVLAAISQFEGFVDGLETLVSGTNTLLSTINSNVDQLESFVDGIEGLITATNALLTSIRDNADQLEGYLDGVEGLLLTLNSTATAIETIFDVNLSTRASESTLLALNAKVIKVDTDHVLVTSSVLPTGASTETTLSALSTKIANNYGATSGAVRVAAQIGNSTAIADFGAGTISSQTIRVVLPTDQTTIPVSQSGSWTVTANAGTNLNTSSLGTSANQSTMITALQLIDNLPHANNSSLVNGVPMMGQLDDTSTTAATEDNVSVVRITAQRASHSNIRNNAGTEMGTSTNPFITRAGDGTNVVAIKAASTAAVAADPAIVVAISPNNTITSSSKTPLTANAPFTISVGNTSTSFLASNTVRKGLIITNTSTQIISFAFGATAVLNSGITLYPGGSWTMDEFSFSTSAVNSIAGAAASSVAGQEYQ